MPAEHDVDDLLAVEGVRERGAQLRVEQLAILLLLRIGVEAEVADLRPLARDELDRPGLAELVGDGERHLVDVVDVTALERCEHGVGVREPGDADRVEIRLRAVEAGVALHDRRALLVVLRDVEGAGSDDRHVRRGVVVLEALALDADLRLPDVPREHEELLQLRQHVRDGLVVVDDERGGIGRRQLGRVREERRERRGDALLVLQDQVARPGAVVGREGLAVRPLARLDLERPGQAVLGDRPALGPVALELELRVVLHEGRIGVREDDVRTAS